MTNAEQMLIQDAIETALKAEIKRQKLKAGLLVACIVNVVLLGIIGGLMWIAI